MRHRVFGRKLGRNIDARRRLFRNQAVSLILNGSLTTTISKIKAVQGFVERLVTKAKVNNLTSKRHLLKKLNSPKAVEKLLMDIGPLFTDTGGGYTRLVKLGQRQGDNAILAQLTFTKELINLPAEAKSATKESVKKKPKISDKENAKNKKHQNG